MIIFANKLCFVELQKESLYQIEWESNKKLLRLLSSILTYTIQYTLFTFVIFILFSLSYFINYNDLFFTFDKLFEKYEILSNLTFM